MKRSIKDVETPDNKNDGLHPSTECAGSHLHPGGRMHPSGKQYTNAGDAYKGIIA